MRLSNLAIVFATAAVRSHATDATLATTGDIKTINEELTRTENLIQDIETMEATIEKDLGIVDGTTTTDETTGTTGDGTLTFAEPCPLHAAVMCDDDENTVTKTEGKCSWTECVPKDERVEVDPIYCDGVADGTDNTMICEQYFDEHRQCFDYMCYHVDPPPPTYCAGSVDPKTDPCPAGVVETKDETNGCILLQCAEQRCDQLTALASAPLCELGSFPHFFEDSCSYKCQPCDAKCPYDAQVLAFKPASDGTKETCNFECSCPTKFCATGQLLIGPEPDCTFNCVTPCTPPTCGNDEYLVEVDADKCTYECNTIVISRKKGGGKKTTSDGGDTTAKPCRGKKCKRARKNLRA